MVFKETINQYNLLSSQINQSSNEMFDAISEAGLIREESLEDGEYIMKPTRSFSYDGFEVFTKFIDIKGERYDGCGEYSGVAVHVPFEAFEDREGYIQSEKLKIEKVHQERKTEEQRQDSIRQEANEKETYQRLKEKFEGVSR